MAWVLRKYDTYALTSLAAFMQGNPSRQTHECFRHKILEQNKLPECVRYRREIQL